MREFILTHRGVRSAAPASRLPPVVGSRMYVGVRDDQVRVALAISTAAP